MPVSIVLSRVNVEVDRYEEVKNAARLATDSHAELLVKVFQLSQELNIRVGEMTEAQRTLGILLYKLGKTKTSDGVGIPHRFTRGEFSQDDNSSQDEDGHL